MVTTFQNPEEKSSQSATSSFSERSIFPILPANKLLSSIKRQKWLAEIHSLVEIPEAHYDALYQKLIDDFAELVQLLPVNNEARLGSLLDDGLLRGLFVLQLQHAEGEAQEPLMTYVLFSAALLLDVGHVLEDRMVIISDKQGAFLREWYPYEGAMQPADGYYKIRRDGGIPPWVCRRVTPILARQVIPAIGFNWLAKDSAAFNVWLALLYGDKDGAGALSFFFQKAQELLEEFKTSEEYLQLIDEEGFEPEETAIAEDFLEWFKQGLEDGSISINKPEANVQVAKEGVILRVEPLIKAFIEKHPVTKTQVLQQLEKIGLTKDAKQVEYKLATTPATAKTYQTSSSLFSFQSAPPKTQQTSEPAGLPRALELGVGGGSVSAIRLGIMLAGVAARIAVRAMQAAINSAVQITSGAESLQATTNLPPVNNPLPRSSPPPIMVS